MTADFPPQETDHVVLKPDANAFLHFYLVQRMVVFALIIFGAYALWAGFAAVPPFIYFLFSFIVLLILTYTYRFFQFEKESYRLYDRKFVLYSGGLLNDFENELKVTNVTLVRVRQPFIEHALFGTGDVLIESAGAQATEIHLRSIKDSDEVYDRIVDIMKNNDFALSRDELVQQERPHPLGVLFEVFQMFAGGIAGLFYLLVISFGEEGDGVLSEMIPMISPWMMTGAGVALAVWCGYLFIRFLDISRREYFLYKDTIEYKEGFLNKERSVIPMENLADSAVTQSFISRMFGLFDIKLSCQGGGHEILFSNIKNGKSLSDNIDRILAGAREQGKEIPKPVPGEIVDRPSTAPVVGKSSFRTSARSQDYDRDVTMELKMTSRRVWLPVLLCSPVLVILFPVGIIVVIATIIHLKSNYYSIKSDSIAHRNQFINKSEREFALEKITGIVIRRNILDRMVKTCSVTFWSIGSDQNIAFSAVPYSEAFRDQLLGKKGIKDRTILYDLPSVFSFKGMLLANVVGSLFLVALMAAPLFVGLWLVMVVVVVLWGLVFLYKRLYYRRQRLTCYRDYLHFHRGVIRLEDVYTLYDDVKDITTVRYPLIDTGRIVFNVAGESFPLNMGVAQPVQAGGARMRMVSNRFTVHYVPKIQVMDEMIDTIFDKRPGAQEIALLMENPVDTSLQSELSAKPALSNALAGHLLWLLPLNAGTLLAGGGGVPPLILTGILSVVVLAWTVISVRAVSDQIQGDRVLQRSGVIYKRQTSVVYSKIDFVNVARGPVNNLFGNGTITINTVGSSLPEMIIRNIPNYREFYETLKTKYEK